VNPSIRPLLLACALVAGCASFTEEQCRRANWYRLGEQDALLYGLQPQINQLAYQCEQAGVQIPEKDYMAGWTVGDRERKLRLGAPR
jgi:hypothetical protein